MREKTFTQGLFRILLFVLVLFLFAQTISAKKSSSQIPPNSSATGPQHTGQKLSHNHAVPLEVKPGEISRFTYKPEHSKNHTEIKIHISPSHHHNILNTKAISISVFGELNQNGKKQENVPIKTTCEGTLTLLCTFETQSYPGLVLLTAEVHGSGRGEEKCSGRLSISEKREFSLVSNSPQVFHFTKREKESFEFEVPGKENMDRMVLTVDFHNKHSGSKFEHHLASYKLELGRPAVFHNSKRLVLAFSNQDKTLNYECTNTIELTSHINSFVTITLHIYKAQENVLSREIPQVDVHFHGIDNTTYQVQIPVLQKERHLLLRLRTITGKNKLLFANIGSRPKKFNDYEFKNELHLKDNYALHGAPEGDLFIPSDSVSDKILYVAVVGESGLFELQTIIRTESLQTLAVGSHERSSLFNKEVMSYEFLVWENFTSNATKDRNVSIDLTFSSGAGNVYVASCESNCKALTPQELEKVDLC